MITIRHFISYKKQNGTFFKKSNNLPVPVLALVLGPVLAPVIRIVQLELILVVDKQNKNKKIEKEK